MSISHEDYLDIKRKMGAKSAKEAVKASNDYLTTGGKKFEGREFKTPYAYKVEHGDKRVRGAKSKALGKKVDMKPFFKEQSSKGFNPFSLVTHINGKPIKKKSGDSDIERNPQNYQHYD